MAEKWIVGVDGGGTKTDFVLCGADGSVAARTLTGGSNVNESGLPAVGALLEEGVSRLLELSGVPRSGITALFAGLSGILSDGGKQAEKLREFLEERLPGARCRVDGDAVNCLRSGVRQGDGLAVIGRHRGSTAFAWQGRRVAPDRGLGQPVRRRRAAPFCHRPRFDPRHPFGSRTAEGKKPS